ncbi:DUF29 domain-containing protein [Paraburkholderia sp. B3]|uniref:DUF29 domain-containing protein n=1 Tax=Paraburkholderia sp. B3 TaxID=3134791 RepID=UPI003982B1E5
MPAYDEDVYAWAFEQARFLREGRFDLLDIEHLADEIEDVGKAELRELVKDISLLLAHLLKWYYLPSERTASRSVMVDVQRLRIGESFAESPSLRERIDEPRKCQLIWAEALAQAAADVERDCFPTECPWVIANILSKGWLPT